MNKLARLQDKGTKDAGRLGTHSTGVAPVDMCGKGPHTGGMFFSEKVWR